ncbi:MAG: hypothetical protein BJ554DRAFT_4990 [Olpidium bornovanus]|uniref:Uncharacterized protein n=1 Tax=Olpidium bornovanus TaxID=278681 RepID=A0A8H7ZLS3_9FUNG|nr:MAG: hypothetical protein BJ554DRAFT_4990 [Olpidium bornovanus]
MEGERDAVNASAAELQSQRAALEERIADFEEERKRSEATRRELEENLRATEEKFKVAQERCGELQKEVESARVASPRTGSEDVAGRLRAAERERDGIREVLAKLDGRNRDLQRELERAERRLQSRGLDITPSPSEDGDDDRRRQIQAIDVLERKLDLTTRERDGYRDRCFVLEEEKLVLEGALATLESARADGARGAAAARPERGASSLGGSAAEELRTALREAEAEREMWRRKTEAALADLEAAREKTQEAAARRGALESELAEVRAKSPAGPQEAQERSGPGARRAEEALESEVAKLRALLEEKQAAATSAQDLLESKSAELRGLQRKFDEHQLDHSAFASQEAEVARLTSDLGAAKREMEVLRTNLYGAEVSVKKAAARHEAEQQLEESERAAGALKEEVDRLSAALAAAESRAARAEEIERQFGKANEARDAAGLEVSRLERELREAERAATSSDTEDGSDAGASRAAELESQVTKLKALLEEERATAASARDALISHSSDLLSLKQTLEEEDRKHSEAAAAQQAEIERLEAGVAAAAREAEELRADRSKAEAFLKKASDGREAEFEERLAEVERSYAAQISQMDDRLAEAERRLEAAGAGAGAAAEMAAEAEKLREELAVAKTRAAQAEASVELTANAKASAEERERKLAARLREVEEECEAKMSRAAEECEERAKQAEEKCRIAEEEADRVLAKNMDMMIRLAMYE